MLARLHQHLFEVYKMSARTYFFFIVTYKELFINWDAEGIEEN